MALPPGVDVTCAAQPPVFRLPYVIFVGFVLTMRRRTVSLPTDACRLTAGLRFLSTYGLADHEGPFLHATVPGKPCCIGGAQE
ncbi:hypothetical protein HK14_07660 [Acetobacter cibinongensis]|uniref:Uncharacterized protein n=1 Tax=Acetobacter cibinongensis TaxID=146475 RepID=A0A1Z5YTZ7_9PROT|nr:hypothetical protein HK14_07660 [Acetobacter cibinongensis]